MHTVYERYGLLSTIGDPSSLLFVFKPRDTVDRLTYIQNMSTSSQSMTPRELQRKTHFELAKLQADMATVYQRNVQPLASVLCFYDSHLVKTSQRTIDDLLWSVNPEAGEGLTTIATALEDARRQMPQSNASVLADRLITSLSWFVGSREERRALGVTRPPGQSRFSFSEGSGDPTLTSDSTGPDEGRA